MAEDNLSCVCFGAQKIRFETRPIPQIQDLHDVLIRVSFVGVCGSDVHFWQHGGMSRKASEDAPIVMGHEASGVVHSVGPAVTSLKPGDRVAIEPGFPCRRCRHCKSGRYNLCGQMRFAADPPQDGTLARFFRIPEDFAYKIPDSLSLEEAVLVEPLGVAVHVSRLASLKPGQSVLVLGCGTIGLLTAAVARAFGINKVYMADIKDSKTEFAKQFVDCTTFMPDLKATPTENADRFRKETGLTDGVDVVLECTGVESSAQLGIYALQSGGTYIQVGMGQPLQALPLLAMCDKEITLKASFRYSVGDYELALEMLACGKLTVKPLISSIVPFEDAVGAWEKTLRGEGIKNLIRGVPE